MPLQATSGAASYDAFGGGVPVVPKYIEDAFSCFLYSGTSANQIITNGINLSTDGGLVWIKRRSSVTAHALFDTNRGVQKYLQSNTTDAEGTASTSLTAFFTDGFRVGADSLVNEAGETYVSWTLKQQPKFFDVVTYPGDGTDGRAVPHNLGSVPGCVIVKSTTIGTGWPTYHRGMATSNPESWEMYLNTTAARTVNGTWGGAPTSTNFYVNNLATVNQSGDTYVAYIFAHDAGGFGLSGSDNVISCGSFTGTGSDVAVNLGYEPQWLLVKRASSGTDNWRLYDNMRGMFANFDDNVLFPNTSGAEAEGLGNVRPTATGFDVAGGFPASGVTYIYIAIRRGPMKVPTSGTSVFAPIAYAGTNTAGQVISGASFPPDLSIFQSRAGAGGAVGMFDDRLRGGTAYLPPSSTAAESTVLNATVVGVLAEPNVWSASF